MAKYDPELLAHKTWLGLLQPVGLVVSPLALIRAQAVLDKNILDVQGRLRALVRTPPKTVSPEQRNAHDNIRSSTQRTHQRHWTEAEQLAWFKRRTDRIKKLEAERDRIRQLGADLERDLGSGS